MYAAGKASFVKHQSEARLTYISINSNEGNTQAVGMATNIDPDILAIWSLLLSSHRLTLSLTH
jgi:hypothetical protein